MSTYLRPGIYYERVDAPASNRTLIRSDVPAFIGIAEKGPLDRPVRVESFRQFQAHFGDFIGAGFLAYSARAFFENGGRRCWIVRVASRDFDESLSSGLGANVASTVIGNGVDDYWAIEASSEGSWGNQLSVSLVLESVADAAIISNDNSGFYSQVSTTAGFQRGTLVAIEQEDSVGVLQTYYRVVNQVDESDQRLYWQAPDQQQAFIYDQVLTELDANQSARIHSISYRINVYREGQLLASYSELSLIPEHPNYGPLRLSGYEGLESNTIPAPIKLRALQENSGEIPQPLQIETLVQLPLSGGRDGLTRLSHQDFIGQEPSVYDSDQQRAIKTRGIASLHFVNEITLVAIPDIVIQPQADAIFEPQPKPEINPCLSCPLPPEPQTDFVAPEVSMEMSPVFTDAQIYQVQAAMVAHCEQRGDRFAIIDPPLHIADNALSGIAEIRSWRNRFDSSYAALYYPWIKVIEPRAKNQLVFSETIRSIPPSGHALGQYALFDTETGVHRAPANRVLMWCQDLTLHTTVGQQELLNPLHINVIRSEGPRGLRIMGARALSSDPGWRYINVRRLMIMIKRVLNIISEWVVFEPNNANTRNKFQVAITSYLNRLLSQGALAGETAQ